jgi:hypothetical protein
MFAERRGHRSAVEGRNEAMVAGYYLAGLFAKKNCGFLFKVSLLSRTSGTAEFFLDAMDVYF